LSTVVKLPNFGFVKDSQREVVEDIVRKYDPDCLDLEFDYSPLEMLR